MQTLNDGLQWGFVNLANYDDSCHTYFISCKNNYLIDAQEKLRPGYPKKRTKFCKGDKLLEPTVKAQSINFLSYDL